MSLAQPNPRSWRRREARPRLPIPQRSTRQAARAQRDAERRSGLRARLPLGGVACSNAHGQRPARLCPAVAPAPPQATPGGCARPDASGPLGCPATAMGRLVCSTTAADSAGRAPSQVVMTSHEQSLAKPLLIPPSERGTLLRWPALLRALSGEGSCPCSLQDEEFSSGSASTRLAYNTAS